MSRPRFSTLFTALMALALLTGALVASGAGTRAAAGPTDRWIDVSWSCCGDQRSHVSMGGAWTGGMPVTLEVDRGNNLSIDETQNGTTPTDFFVDPMLAPGDRVIVTSDGVAKELVVEDLFVEYASSGTDVVAGRAPAGRTVEVVADPEGTRATLSAIADGTGHWSVDFTGTFDIEEHDPSGPATSAQLVNASLVEDGGDGDATTDGRPVDRATINVLPDCCGDQAIVQDTSQGWRVGTQLQLDVDRGTDGSIEFTKTLTYTGQPGLTAPNELAPLAPGDTVTVSGAGWVKDVFVVPLTITDVDAATDVVSGTATLGDEIRVDVSTPNVPGPPNATSTVTVTDPGGAWSIDFTSLYDIPPTDQAHATIEDGDHDTLGAIFFPSSPPPGRSLTPSPDTDLSDGDTIGLAASGWPTTPGAPGRMLHVTECAFGFGGSADSCDPSTARSYVLDPDGSLPASQTFTVKKVLAVTLPGQTTWDCSPLNACGLLAVVYVNDDPGQGIEVSDLPGQNYVNFAGAAPGTVDVDPTTDLDDGDMVAVHLEGFAADQYVEIVQCGPAGPLPPPYSGVMAKTCQSGVAVGVDTVTDPDGALDVQFRVARYLIRNGQYSVTPQSDLLDPQDVTVAGTGYRVDDCADVACTIEVRVTSGQGAPQSVPIQVNDKGEVPTLVVRENWIGQDPGIVMFPNLTGGTVAATLVGPGVDGTYDFAQQYQVRRYLNVSPSVPEMEAGAPPGTGGNFGFLTNPIDCATLADDLVAHGIDPGLAHCLIDVRPPETTLGGGYTPISGFGVWLYTGLAYPTGPGSWLEFEKAWPTSGFFAPVANPPAVNSVKAGSTVTLKFGLGGDRGLDIFATGYPASAEYACGTQPTPTSGQPTTGQGPKALSYQAQTQRYQYLWQTDKTWKGTCRQLVLKFADGTSMRANFQFK